MKGGGGGGGRRRRRRGGVSSEGNEPENGERSLGRGGGVEGGESME